MVRLIRCAAALLCTALIFCACKPPSATAQCWAYDTLCSLTVQGIRDPAALFEQAAKEGETLLNADGTKQYYASAPGETLTVSDDLARILRMARRLTEETDGVFDLSVAPLAALWDVNHRTSPPSPEEIAAALEKVGADQLSLNGNTLTFAAAGAGLDIGSVGKGYGADRTVKRLKEAGASAGVVSFGGNVAVFGKKDGGAFRIGVRDPQNIQGYFGILSVNDVSVVTSGAYERYFEADGVRYHHLLDAKTGYPRQSDLLSVTVVCADGAQADLLSTALWLAGGEEAERILSATAGSGDFLPAEAIFVFADGTVKITDGLKDKFELTKGNYTLKD